MAGERGRRGYLDWMRGLAVIVMIEAHLLDSWTRVADRESVAYQWAMVAGGFGAPLFLFLAGVAVALSAGAKARASGNAAHAARTVARRGCQIFALAFLFRLQALVLGWGPAWTLLKVDVLNIMGPALVATAALWACTAATHRRVLTLVAACLMTTIATPFVHSASGLSALPDAVEAYLRPIPQLTNFAFFPWMGFVFAGAAFGVLLDRARSIQDERVLNVAAGKVAVAVALVSYGMSHLPTPFPDSDFWTTSPAFFALRAGIILAATTLAFAWESRPGATRWSPLRQLGRTSLFIYWIHVELVYGLISLPLHESLPLPYSLVAFAAFVALMLACSIWKDRFVTSWRERRAARVTALNAA